MDEINRYIQNIINKKEDLKIDQAKFIFEKIMSGNMDIMQGIVKLLTGRLRDAIK